MIELQRNPLTKAGFSPFGDVIEIEGARHFTINQGFAERYDDLAPIDVSDQGGGVKVSLFTADLRPQPIVIDRMERHPLGSQLFYPLQGMPWLAVVCTNPYDDKTYHAFACSGRQGVNYAKGIWHFPLLVIEESQLFLVVDRKGTGNNLEEVLAPKFITVGPPQKKGKEFEFYDMRTNADDKSW